MQPQDIILETQTPNLHLLPSHIDLVGAEIEMIGVPNREFMMRSVLEKVKDSYDFIIIDLPPNLGDHTINGLTTADHAIAIFQPEPFCYDGLTRYLETIEDIKEINSKLTVLGIVTSMMDPIASLDEIIYQKALKHYGDLVFKTVIKRRARIKEYSLVGVQKTTVS